MSLWASGDLPADVPVVLPDGVTTKDVPNVAKMLTLIAAKLTETAQLKALDVPSSVFGRGRLADADAAAQRTALGLKKASMVDILGTLVAPDAGGLTGAIIERGSNANGEYVKFADGTMICRVTRTFPTKTVSPYSPYLLGFDEGTTSWGWPAAFTATPSMSYGQVSSYSYGVKVACEYVTANIYANFFLSNVWNSNLTTDTTLYIVAIGRWY